MSRIQWIRSKVGTTRLFIYNWILLQTIVIKKVGGSLGLSIVGGTDHTSHPFGLEEPGIFISKVEWVLYQILNEMSDHASVLFNDYLSQIQ